MADAKDAARGSRLSMESKKRHLDELYRFALKKCDDKAAGNLWKKKYFLVLRVIVHVIIHSNASSDDAAFVYFVEYVSMSCSVDDAYL